MFRDLIEGLRVLIEASHEIVWELVDVPVEDLLKSFKFEFDRKNDKKLEYLVKRLKSGNEFPPIMVLKLKGEDYQILDGHHRVAAFKEAGKKTMPTLLGHFSEV